MANTYKGKPIPDEYCDPVFNVIMTSPVKLNCGHVFHKTQITRWTIKTPKNNTCPLCRATIETITDQTQLGKEAVKWLVSNGFSDVAFSSTDGVPFD